MPLSLLKKNPRHKKIRPRHTQTSSLESLEPRQLLTTLYWATNGPGATGPSDFCDLTAANWTTAKSGTGPLQAWSPGDTVVFNNVTLDGGTYNIPAGTRFKVAGNLTLKDGAVLGMDDGGSTLKWCSGGLTLDGSAFVTNNATLNWNGNLRATNNSQVAISGGTFNFNRGQLRTDTSFELVNGNTTNINGGNVQITSWFQVENSTLNLIRGSVQIQQAGYLYNEGTINAFGTNVVVDGTIDTSGTVNWCLGTLVVDNGGTLSNSKWGGTDDSGGNAYSFPGLIAISGGGVLFVPGSTLKNSGVSTLANTYHAQGIIDADGGMLIILPGTDVQNDGIITSDQNDPEVLGAAKLPHPAKRPSTKLGKGLPVVVYRMR